MAMSSEEVIRLLKPENYTNLDPALKRTVSSIASSAIKKVDLYEAENEERAAAVEENKKIFEDIYYLMNRFISNDKSRGKDKVSEVEFWRNIVCVVLLNICESYVGIENAEVAMSKVLSNTRFVLRNICLHDTGGFLCPYCKIEGCPVRSKLTREDLEKLAEQFEINNRERKDEKVTPSKKSWKFWKKK